MKRMKQSKASIALGVISAAVATLAQAQAQQLERVEITGSSIKRIQLESPSPVEIVRRADIERTGATTVSELLRSISTIDIYEVGEQAPNSASASGTSFVRLRGLYESAALVLLNGRRLPINGLYDSGGSGAAVDLNMIPLAAIERIEILKDGGSAIYGADALAGVVNFITRKSYNGAEMRLGYGAGQQRGGEERSAGLTFGFGDLDARGYNVFAGIDLFKRKPILRTDREISSTADYRSKGGPDARSFFSPSGTFIDVDGFPTGVTVRPCPADSFNEDACRYDYNASGLLTAYNGADRLSGLVIGTLQLPRDIRLTGELLLAHSRDHFDGLPVPDFFVAPSGDTYLGRFMQGGPRRDERRADLYQLSAGLDGSVGNVDWKVDLGQGRSRVVNTGSNYFDRTLYDAATTSGAIDPTVTSNPQALVDSLKVNPRREGTSTVTFANLKASGEAWTLPGGPLGYAVGHSLWRETLVDQPDALTQAGLVVGNVQQAGVDASRNVYAFFGELALPLSKSFEGQIALRYDHYATYSRPSPKLALRYVVDPRLSLRASYSSSFRAPGLKQLYGAREEGAGDFTSAPLCAALGRPADCRVPGLLITGANRDLKPERGQTFNLGSVFEPVPELSLGLDWWRVNVKDAIDTPTIDQAVRQGQFGRDSTGRVTVTTALTNFAKISNQGVDFDLRWTLPASDLGAFSVRNTATYYTRQRKLIDSETGWEEFNGTYLKPRWRNTFTLGLESGRWQGNFVVHNTAGFYDVDTAVADGTTERRVEGFSELDLTGSYSGFKGVKIEFGIKNLLNETPPFSVQNVASTQYTNVGYAELYSGRGRFYYASINYAF